MHRIPQITNGLSHQKPERIYGVVGRGGRGVVGVVDSGVCRHDRYSQLSRDSQISSCSNCKWWLKVSESVQLRTLCTVTTGNDYLARESKSEIADKLIESEAHCLDATTKMKVVFRTNA